MFRQHVTGWYEINTLRKEHVISSECVWLSGDVPSYSNGPAVRGREEESNDCATSPTTAAVCSGLRMSFSLGLCKEIQSLQETALLPASV